MATGRLAGKVCVITGTGGSTGRATALTFAREGAAVVGCDVGVEAAEPTSANSRTSPTRIGTPPAATRSTCSSTSPAPPGPI
jgi:NAD(P)-dependent dehydrogenase (short-subunit alcohol dehydrogenase family)